MADHEYTLTHLSIRVRKPAGPNVTIIVKFTSAGETYKATLPAIPRGRFRRIISRFRHAIRVNRHPADITGGDDFTVELIE